MSFFTFLLVDSDLAYTTIAFANQYDTSGSTSTNTINTTNSTDTLITAACCSQLLAQICCFVPFL
jgi:hypothetical protein